MTTSYYKLTYYIYFYYLLLVCYLYDTYESDKLYIIKTVCIYEFGSLILAIKDNDTLLMKMHHSIASTSLYIFYAYYINNELYNDVIWCALLLIIPNLVKELYYNFNINIIKYSWGIIFGYCRIYKIYPYFIKLITNYYGKDSDNYLYYIMVIGSFGFYILSVYWFILMIRKVLLKHT